MRYTFDKEDYNCPEILDQEELDAHMKMMMDLKTDIEDCLKLYTQEMTQE